MAVPARPASGAPIESAWGGVAHDTAVAQDIQTGTLTVAMGGTTAATGPVTFPRPFAGVPAVVTTPVWASGFPNPTTSHQGAPTAAGVTVRCNTASASSQSVLIHWIAIGPRA